jgi:hypothetical protein
LPAVVLRHRRQTQLDWTVSKADAMWRVTREGWTLIGSDFEVHATGVKKRDQGYRVFKNGTHWASFSSAQEAVTYVIWRAPHIDPVPARASS